MSPQARTASRAELAAARAAEAAGDPARAFAHLERAHILSQRRAFAHASVHLAMLRHGWRRRDVREIAGQLPRMLAALLVSRIWIPRGNTGGARVSAFAPMPVPDDLAALID